MDRPEKRIAILGTAPTWRDCPWDDPTLEVWALNDAHVLHLPRADRWFDIHPIAEMYFHDRSQALHAGDVPAGKFVRPVGHLEWLRSQTIPVYRQRCTPSLQYMTPLVSPSHAKRVDRPWPIKATPLQLRHWRVLVIRYSPGGR